MALAQERPNGWDNAALTFDIIGVCGVVPTMVVGSVSEFCPSWVPAKNWTGGVTVGSLVLGWTFQGVAAWSHMPEPTGDNWMDKHTPLHVLGSAGAVGGLYALARVCRVSKPVALGGAAGGALVVGAGVECWQQWSGRGWISGKDLAVDAASVALTAAVLALRSR